jgi:hypothetical protein
MTISMAFIAPGLVKAAVEIRLGPIFESRHACKFKGLQRFAKEQGIRTREQGI